MNFSNFVNRKSVFLGGLLGVGVAFLIQFLYKQELISRSFFKNIAEPLFVIAGSILFVSFALFLAKEEVFKSWLRFAYWWIPLSLVLIYLAAGSSGGGFGIPNIFDQEFVAFVLSLFFVSISLILIVIKSLLLRGK